MQPGLVLLVSLAIVGACGGPVGPAGSPSRATKGNAMSEAGPSSRPPPFVAPADDVDASMEPGHQGEVSIAVDRNRAERAVAASMDLLDGRLLIMSSDDGGRTWVKSRIPVSEGALYDADPWVGFDSRGRAFLARIPVASGNRPVGIEVAPSDDGGRTWGRTVRISHNFSKDDKVALEVDDHEGSPFRDAIHVAWKWPGGGVLYSRSLDSGVTFSEPRLLASTAVSGLDFAVDAGGGVYLALYDHDRRSIRVYRSVDGGGTFFSSQRIAPVRAGWFSIQPAHCRRQSLTHAAIDIDPAGSLYATWADYEKGVDPAACARTACSLDDPCHTEVYFSLSRDHGGSWSEPIAVSDEGTLNGDRFFSWVAADPANGTVAIAYKDTRAAPTREGTDVFLSRSNDCGLSFERAIRLSSASSFAETADFQYGDYQGVDAASGNVYAAWTDYRPDASGRVGASEIYVGRFHEEASAGWRALRDERSLVLSFTGRNETEVLADVFAYAVSPYDGALTYFTASGLSSTPAPYETMRVATGAPIRVELRVSDLTPAYELHAVVVPFGEGPDSGHPLSSKLRVRLGDLLEGRSIGCR
jgi:hypothetical protein